MGTRALTVFKEENGKEIVVLYQQMDGYPGGHGEELAEFLKGFTIVNGLGGNKTKIANGMGCLAAQVVAHFKTDPGQFYLYPAGTRDCGEEFIYTIYAGGKSGLGKVNMKVQSGCVTFFGLPGTKQANMPVLYDGPADDFDAVKVNQVLNEVKDETPNDFTEEQKKNKGAA